VERTKNVSSITCPNITQTDGKQSSYSRRWRASVCLPACSSSNTFGQMKRIQFLRTNDDNLLSSSNEQNREPPVMLQGLSGYTWKLSLDEFKLL
jgi:hypothetical protein